MDLLKEILAYVEELNAFISSKKESNILVSPEFIEEWEEFKPARFVRLLEDYDHQKENPQKLLDLINDEVKACTKCPLHKTRTQTVFGSGNPKAQLVFVGEAPGAEEDRQGLPFVGRAGQLLTDIIVKGMKMKREDVYICNVLKCRPPNNREPNPMEVFHCEPYLLRQLEIIKPKVICALGRVAAQTLLKTTDSIEKLRGKWHNYHGIPLRVTYHPAYLLRNPADKKKAWLDIQEIIKLLKGEIEVKFDNDNTTTQSQLF